MATKWFDLSEQLWYSTADMGIPAEMDRVPFLVLTKAGNLVNLDTARNVEAIAMWPEDYRLVDVYGTEGPHWSPNDLVAGGGGRDTINGEGGNDTIYGGYGVECEVCFRPQYCDPDFYGRDTSADYLYGGAGDDCLFGELGSDMLDGGTGNDHLFGGQGADTLYGQEGDDYLDGGRGKDTIYGGAGNDYIEGGLDGDRLFGDDGADFIKGECGSDTIQGGNGNDTIFGGSGNDNIQGNNNDDAIVGGSGNDTINGGSGNDVLYGDGEDCQEDGDCGVCDGPCACTDDLEIYNDSILGGAGDDCINGQMGDDILKGGTGNDTIVGEDGNDVLQGEGGDDVLCGGKGHANYLTGGAGLDTFVVAKNGDADVDVTIIQDFDAAADTLCFNGFTDGELEDAFITEMNFEGVLSTVIIFGDGDEVMLKGIYYGDPGIEDGVFALFEDLACCINITEDCECECPPPPACVDDPCGCV